MRVLVWIVLVLTGIWAVMWFFPLVNRIVFVLNEGDYRRGTLVVADAEYIPERNERLSSWWAIGEVRTDGGVFPGEHVSLIGEIPEPSSRREILDRVPAGTEYEVLINPEVPFVISQDESLRVVRSYPGFFDDQRAMARMMAIRGIGPFVVCLALGVPYLIWEKRNRGGGSVGGEEVDGAL